MSSVVISGDTSGTVSLTVPAVAGTNTATLPAATGTVMVSGNMPAFSAYMSGNQTISNNTSTKLTLNTERFDTNNCYDSTTNYRFTPNVAGYYQVNANVDFAGTAGRQYYLFASPYKNGSTVSNVGGILSIAMGTGTESSVYSNSLVYMNGTTDYLELYAYQYDFTATGTVIAVAAYTSFSATLVRTA